VETTQEIGDGTATHESIYNEELFEAEPSEIDEVFLKVTGEKVETNLITTSTSKPEKYAPRFCLKLKFNCKLRSAHPCCKYPLPPRDENQASATAVPKIAKIKVRPTRRQNTPAVDTEVTNSFRKSPFRRPLKRQPVRKVNESENEVSDKQGEQTIYIKNSQNNRRRIPNKGNTGRPSKLSPNTVRRRPTFSSGGKSPVCRIINCRRNTKHKCCQEPKEITPETKEPESVTELNETTLSITNKAEEVKNKSVKSESVSQKESITAVETTIIQDTSPRSRIKDINKETIADGEAFTTHIMLSTTVEPIEREQNTVTYEDDLVTIMTYKVMDPVIVHTLENKIDMEYKTTTIKGEKSVDYTTEEETTITLPMPIKDKEAMLSDHISNQQVQAVSTEQTKTERPLVKPEQGLQYMNTTEQSYHNNVKPQLGIKRNTEDNGQHLANDNNNKIEITEQPAHVSLVNTEETRTKKFQQEQQFEDTSIFENPASEYQAYEAKEEYPDYDDFDRVEGKRELVFPDYIYLPDNHIDRDILDTNQILPRVAGKCFRFDCLSQPHHSCCSPHTAHKRKTVQAQTDRVTKTVTRVLKTVSW